MGWDLIAGICVVWVTGGLSGEGKFEEEGGLSG